MSGKWPEARAHADLIAIGDFIAQILTERMRQAKRFPKSGRIVPEFNDTTIRELIEGNYRIVYKLEKKPITVFHIFESHRLFGS